MTIHLFTDDWYSSMIEQVLSYAPVDASSDALVLARSNMVAGAFIAQAIDNAFGHTAKDGKSIPHALLVIAESLHEMAFKPGC